jgi:hypothetical protein
VTSPVSSVAGALRPQRLNTSVTLPIAAMSAMSAMSANQPRTIEHLGHAPDSGELGDVGEPTDNDRAEFAALLAFAQQLRTAI